MNVEAFSDTLGRLYECAIRPDSWTPLLRELAGSIGAHTIAIIPVTPASSPLRFSSSLQKESDDLYYRYWWRHSPFRNVERAEDGHALKLISDTDIISAEAIPRLSYYQEFLRRYDVGGIARVVVNPAPRTRFSVAIQYAIGAPFQTDEQRKLTMLWADHLRHVLKLTALLQQSEQVGALLADRVLCGFAVLDWAGHVLLVNELLERIRGDGLTIRSGRLTAASADAQQQLDNLIERATSARIIARSPDLVRLPRPSGRRSLLVRALRLSPPLLEQIGAPIGSNVMVLVEVDEAPPMDVQVLLRQLGLSAGEARLAIRVADGATPKDIGLAFEIKADSVRSVLKKVFAKLGVGSQNQLSTRIARLSALAEAKPRDKRSS